MVTVPGYVWVYVVALRSRTFEHVAVDGRYDSARLRYAFVVTAYIFPVTAFATRCAHPFFTPFTARGYVVYRCRVAFPGCTPPPHGLRGLVSRCSRLRTLIHLDFGCSAFVARFDSFTRFTLHVAFAAFAFTHDFTFTPVAVAFVLTPHLHTLRLR